MPISTAIRYPSVALESSRKRGLCTHCALDYLLLSRGVRAPVPALHRGGRGCDLVAARGVPTKMADDSKWEPVVVRRKKGRFPYRFFYSDLKPPEKQASRRSPGNKQDVFATGALAIVDE